MAAIRIEEFPSGPEHLANDERQIRLTFLGLAIMAVVIVGLIMWAIMRA